MSNFLRPNIDATGRKMRLIGGIFTQAGALAALFGWAIPTQSVAAWATVIGLFVAGDILIVQAVLGVCFARACGMKTRY